MLNFYIRYITEHDAEPAIYQVFIRIDEALQSADDPDILTAVLLETGAFHKKIPGFRPEMFRVSFPCCKTLNKKLARLIFPSVKLLDNYILV